MVGPGWRKKSRYSRCFFKIVIREEGNSVETLAFIIPNIIPKDCQIPGNYLVTIDRIESLTGLDFLTILDDATERDAEKKFSTGANW